MDYRTKGTCASNIHFEVDDNDVITECAFQGGCMGNTQGVAALVKGRRIDEVVGLLEGIQCGWRGTSCPDQLAKALKAYQASRA